MKLPNKITPDPIIEATVEFRFSSNVNENAVFPLLYAQLQNDFKTVEQLPILQLPEQIRKSDPNLLNKPHYKISNDTITLLIGPNVFAVSSVQNYIGWDRFSNEIFSVFKLIGQTSVIKDVNRIGLRYINFFNFNIFEKINLNISLNNKEIDYRNSALRTQIPIDIFNANLQVANNASFNNKTGSVIDIDVLFEKRLPFQDKNFYNILNDAHNSEKELFFSLLKIEYLNSLNPIYYE